MPKGDPSLEMSGQNNGGLKFQKCGERDHAAVWRVTRV
jgi:hypothetical protein